MSSFIKNEEIMNQSKIRSLISLLTCSVLWQIFSTKNDSIAIVQQWMNFEYQLDDEEANKPEFVERGLLIGVDFF